MIDYRSIEQKWQKAWDDAKVFDPEPDEREPFMITAAFPYVNAPQHIGHIRTYGTTDTYARYKRMQGFNVLYPMALHATGTPVLAFAKRIANKDKELIDELRIFHVADDDIMRMSDPEYIASYFAKEMEGGMRAAGYSIDWRRKFISIEPIFSKFVEWQFYKLKEKGYITRGKHPIGWCTNEKNAVGQHDTRHDVQPEIQQVTVVKFKDPSSGIFFGCATYRPETLYGVTNIFVNGKARYVIANIDGNRYYLTKKAAEMLALQFNIVIESELDGSELLSKKAVNPIDNSEVPILPGFFVKEDTGTGVVMSVPAHAPFDYVALERLKSENYPMPEMQYKRVVVVEKGGDGIGLGRSLSDVSAGQAKAEHPEVPALAYLELLHADDKAIDDVVEFATKLLYREESHWGIMDVGEFKGMKEPEARELIKAKLLKEGNAFNIHTVANDEPVYCRCGTKVIVNIVDQWFINYGDKKWKDLVKGMFPHMAIYPEKLRLTFDNLIDWIDLRAAERSQGLGTKFPFSEGHIIESLSDSTIYMCFYTFVHIIRAKDIRVDQLKPEFFEYVILGSGGADAVESATGIDAGTVNRCRESFEYWYKNTSRHSAPDLVPNHLIMYIFNHVGILRKENWPKQIVVNGFVNYEGEKMSKSLGNIIPVVDGIEKYGADPLRFIEIAGADLDTTTEFSADGVSSVHARNSYILESIKSLSSMKSKELSHIDYWLYSKLNSKIRNATSHMEGISLKSAYTEIYYNSINELKRYMDRGGDNGIVVREFLEDMVLMLAPIMPHVAEEFWSMLGKSTLIAKERWPIANDSMVNEPEEMVEEIIDRTIDDIKQSIELTAKIGANKEKRPSEIKIIIASPWKSKAYNMLVARKNMKEVMENGELAGVDKEELSKFLSQFMKRINMLVARTELEEGLLLRAFVEAEEYISDKFGNAKIVAESEKDSKSARASRALPEKPSIDILWD
ncbi:MAG: leucine--tRNA ligase [Candidatus Micrarchaeaceae archaeon]|jgi:leucyl-tRNA synthetase|nr:leucine--tRNA ligase [Candidatus Micrarchaeota archaeon]HII10229.1 leucine--tRNA ligase [Candidatus Micrarchaeota archaeon]